MGTEEDPTISAVESYVRAQKYPAKIVNKTLLKYEPDDEFGCQRVVSRYALDINGRRSFIYAKYYRDKNLAKFEHHVLTELANKLSSDEQVNSVFPIFYSKGVLITQAAEGLPLGIYLKRITPFVWLSHNVVRKLITQLNAVGRWLARFHSTSFPEPLQDDVYKNNTLCTTASHLFDEHYDHWGGVFLPHKIATDISKFLDNKADDRKFISSVGLIHGDFCPENLMVDLSYPRTTILDFEDVNNNYQIMDVARFCAKLRLLEVYRFNVPSILLRLLESSFLEGYNAIRRLDTYTLGYFRFIYLLRIRSPLQYSSRVSFYEKLAMQARRMRFQKLIMREWSVLN